MATAALSPATVCLRLKPLSSTIRFLSLYRHHQPKPTKLKYQISIAPLHHPPQPRVHFNYSNNSTTNNRCFSTVVSATVSPGEVSEKSSTESIGERVGEFRKRLTIVDIKGGEGEGVDRLGQTLTVEGWVRTIRIQSSVTFIEVNDGSCVSNMQCVIGPDAKGYDQKRVGELPHSSRTTLPLCC